MNLKSLKASLALKLGIFRQEGIFCRLLGVIFGRGQIVFNRHIVYTHVGNDKIILGKGLCLGKDLASVSNNIMRRINRVGSALADTRLGVNIDRRNILGDYRRGRSVESRFFNESRAGCGVNKNARSLFETEDRADGNINVLVKGRGEYTASAELRLASCKVYLRGLIGRHIKVFLVAVERRKSEQLAAIYYGCAVVEAIAGLGRQTDKAHHIKLACCLHKLGKSLLCAPCKRRLTEEVTAGRTRQGELGKYEHSHAELGRALCLANAGRDVCRDVTKSDSR